MIRRRPAAFSSPKAFLLPEGDQSDPSPRRMPRALADLMRAVLPYSSRLLSGDQTIAAPCEAMMSKSASVRAVE